jgi:hypothetical protein
LQEKKSANTFQQIDGGGKVIEFVKHKLHEIKGQEVPL